MLELKSQLRYCEATVSSDSFIVESVPFLQKSDTGDSVLAQGFGLTVPLHRVLLLSGQVAMGVCPALPVDGVDIFLGNGLAGSCVWPDVSPSSTVTASPVFLTVGDENVSTCQDVRSASVLTCARSKDQPNLTLLS